MYEVLRDDTQISIVVGDENAQTITAELNDQEAKLQKFQGEKTKLRWCVNGLLETCELNLDEIEPETLQVIQDVKLTLKSITK